MNSILVAFNGGYRSAYYYECSYLATWMVVGCMVTWVNCGTPDLAIFHFFIKPQTLSTWLRPKLYWHVQCLMVYRLYPTFLASCSSSLRKYNCSANWLSLNIWLCQLWWWGEIGELLWGAWHLCAVLLETTSTGDQVSNKSWAGKKWDLFPTKNICCHSS